MRINKDSIGRIVEIIIFIPLVLLFFGALVVSPFLGIFGFISGAKAVEIALKLVLFAVCYMIFWCVILKSYQSMIENNEK